MAFLKTMNYTPTPWISLSRRGFTSTLQSQSELQITTEVILQEKEWRGSDSYRGTNPGCPEDVMDSLVLFLLNPSPAPAPHDRGPLFSGLVSNWSSVTDCDNWSLKDSCL